MDRRGKHMKAWCSIDMTRTGQDQPGPATILRWWGKWCHLRAMVLEDQKCDLEGAGGNVCSSQEALKMRPVLQELTAFKKKSASACSHNSGRQLSSSFGYCNYLESLVGYDYNTVYYDMLWIVMIFIRQRGYGWGCHIMGAGPPDTLCWDIHLVRLLPCCSSPHVSWRGLRFRRRVVLVVVAVVLVVGEGATDILFWKDIIGKCAL